MYQPFAIFGLPRSRTFWLSKWLSYGGAKVEHDLASQVDSIQGFVDRMWACAGTVETGAMARHRLIRHCFPQAKFVTVRRDRSEVAESLLKFQIAGLESELEARDLVLDELETEGAQRIDYGDLANVHCCSWLFEYLLGLPFDFNWWQEYDQANLQVSMAERLVELASRQDKIAGLEAEAAGLEAKISSGFGPPWTTRIGLEAWGSIWPEAEPLGQAQYLEANGGQRSGHPYQVNAPLMQHLDSSGSLRIVSARVNGRLAGYLVWTLSPDAESLGVLLADQGPFYVLPEFAGLKLGRRLYDKSLEILRQLGAHVVYPHHPMQGRGTKLGSLFRRLGAVPMYQRYAIDLRNPSDA